jgi:hypothetical protein
MKVWNIVGDITENHRQCFDLLGRNRIVFFGMTTKEMYGSANWTVTTVLGMRIAKGSFQPAKESIFSEKQCWLLLP